MASTFPAVCTPGNETRQQFLDNVEAALHKPQRRGGAFPNNTAEDVLKRQLKQSEKIRRQLDRMMNKSIRADENWTPDLDIVSASAKNTDSIAKAVATLRALRKDTAEARKGLSDEQLDEVFKYNLRRIASRLADQYWRELLAIKFGADVADVLLSAPMPPRLDQEAR